MKPKKSSKREPIDPTNEMNNAFQKGKIKKNKAKYRHKNHWLEQGDYDFDYPLSRYKNEEE